ncbi:TRAM/LAG1/CLN8 homology domain-containing protein [Strongyloides ratti]|uniref:TRAM/LAG1/CLN8 homology domain-containing protein n=1 Tax=Strongyloides ratti TaxID=34506 RepID=A0A090MWS9_STRRB|nr:TRAM/LAG1/CLN8 homology domain-containing protein [Strongyloides ratti]CEF64214.1 TRAM/LAG1/CLN8 homology domain-containing protein [Strongyloides ratti]
MYAYENSPLFQSALFRDSKYLISLVASFLFFRLITYLARENEIDNTQFSHIPMHKKWRISNEYISLIHALICSVWAIFLIIKLSPGKDIFEFSYYSEMGHMFMMIFGYIISDSIDMIANEWSIRVLVLMFHHILVSIGCLYPILIKHFGGIVIIGFLMEVNTSKFITNNVPWWETFACCLVSIGLLTTNTVLFYRLLLADNFLSVKKIGSLDIEEQNLLDHNGQLSVPTTPYFTAPTTPESVTIGTQTLL